MNARIEKGRYGLRIMRGAEDLADSLRLRSEVFRGGAGDDRDRWDDLCLHFLVADKMDGTLVCSFRGLVFPSGRDVADSYSAAFYDLGGFADAPGSRMEIGRFCIAPDRSDPDILRMAWGGLTDFVDQNGIDWLFGCTSFPGIEPLGYVPAFRYLHDRHLGPRVRLPRPKAAQVLFFREMVPTTPVSAPEVQRVLPPLLRTYLMMGGWVSDHAVIDRDLQTLHVFTAVERAAIPAARKRVLRAILG